MIPGWLDFMEQEVVGCLCGRGSVSARQLSFSMA